MPATLEEAQKLIEELDLTPPPKGRRRRDRARHERKAQAPKPPGPPQGGRRGGRSPRLRPPRGANLRTRLRPPPLRGGAVPLRGPGGLWRGLRPLKDSGFHYHL